MHNQLIIIIIYNYVVSCSPQSLDWTGRLDWWTGLVDWTGGLDWWTGLVDWPVDWLSGLAWWTGSVDCIKNVFVFFTLANENSPVWLYIFGDIATSLHGL